MIRLMCSFSKSEITDDVVTFVLQTPPVTHVNSFVESFDFNDYVPPELGSDNFAHTDRNTGDDINFRYSFRNFYSSFPQIVRFFVLIFWQSGQSGGKGDKEADNLLAKF